MGDPVVDKVRILPTPNPLPLGYQGGETTPPPGNCGAGALPYGFQRGETLLLQETERWENLPLWLPKGR